MYLERDEMKFTILYTLKQFVEPVKMSELEEILTWEKEVMGYFDLAILLDELIEDGYVVETHYRNEKSFALSSKGKDTNQFFSKRVPGSVRRHIDETVGSIKYEEQTDPHAIRTEILPVTEGSYMAALQILDANTPLMELRLFAGSQKEAEKVAKKLKKQAKEIYQDMILRIGGGEKSQEPSETENLS